MAERVFVTPVAGATVIDPVTGHKVPEAGKMVTWGTHWMRRLQEGSIRVNTDKPEPAIKKNTDSVKAK